MTRYQKQSGLVGTKFKTREYDWTVIAREGEVGYAIKNRQSGIILRGIHSKLINDYKKQYGTWE